MVEVDARTLVGNEFGWLATIPDFYFRNTEIVLYIELLRDEDAGPTAREGNRDCWPRGRYNPPCSVSVARRWTTAKPNSVSASA
jgi:hypothetical protein